MLNRYPYRYLQKTNSDSAHYSQEKDDAILESLCEEMGCLGDIADVMSLRETCLAPILGSIPQDRLNQGLEGLPEVQIYYNKFIVTNLL